MILLQSRTCLHNNWHVSPDFAWTASRQQRNDWAFRVQPKTRRELLACALSMNRIYQWMPDEIYRNSGSAINVFLERKHHEHALESPLNPAHAPGTPRPNLRADEINAANSVFLQTPRQAKIEPWRIHGNRQRWFTPNCFALQTPPGAPDGWKPMQHLYNSHHGNLRGVGDQLDSRFAHFGSAHAEQMRAGSCLNRLCQTRGVHIARGFTCGDKNLRRSCHRAGSTRAVVTLCVPLRRNHLARQLSTRTSTN